MKRSRTIGGSTFHTLFLTSFGEITNVDNYCYGRRQINISFANIAHDTNTRHNILPMTAQLIKMHSLTTHK